MIEESGQVVALEDRVAWIETIRRSACQSCTARHGCGQHVLAQFTDGKRHHVRALNRLPLSVGDEVVLGLPEQGLVSGAIVVYLVPLLVLVAVAVSGTLLGLGEPVVIVLSVLSLLASFMGIRLYARLHRDDPRFQPQVLRRIEKNGERISLCQLGT